MLRKNLNTQSTIFALASGRLPSAVAVEKISGPLAFEIAGRLFQKASRKPIDKQQGVYFGSLSDLHGKKIDDCLMLTFVAPHSHTGEDSIEFHCHGSVSIIRKLESTLLELGARPAAKGEFSYRAHLNNKLSPREIESLADVFLAEDPADLTKIYERKDGGLETKISFLKEKLIQTQAVLDTAVDFSEEYSSVVNQARQPLETAIRECSEIIQRYEIFSQQKSTAKVVLAGRPNAGKSSLFNALLGRYRAIVHEDAGTTRDVIEEDIEIRGRRWKLVDTAGVREATDKTEIEGLELGERFLSAASFWILVVDGTEGASKEEELLIERFGNKPHLVLWNKADLTSWKSPFDGRWYEKSIHQVSAKTGLGLIDLWKKLETLVAPEEDFGPLPTLVECERLKHAKLGMEDLLAGLSGASPSLPPEILAEKNREALMRLELVVGEVGTEDVLDRVFGEFCIGK